MNLRELGEDQLLQRIAPHLPLNRSVLTGAGDDCAVVQFTGGGNLLLKTDCVVQGVHFESSASPSAVGWKAMARPLSDFAAMAGRPEFAMVTLLAPSVTSAHWVTEAYRGMAKAARMFNVAIVGGETSRLEGPLALSVSLAGSVEKGRAVSRSGAKAGDNLLVTGRLGGAMRGKHLRFLPRIAEARWLTEHFLINGMMDLSDGLGTDLPRLARASGLAFELDESAVPRTRGCTVEMAISDGEDYELLLAVDPGSAHSIMRQWRRKFPKLPLTRIGRLIQGGVVNDQHLAGYVHFK
ncbi:MAG: thiamine-monophosphate kinase [Chthoniobacterales bacterium]|nr:thiamine-monophosphate kinase [Chthoniobacterales bacterium]